ncbi:helix-turn-helix domain-containing protein [Cypionkella sinensis]|uniref:Helix-turn-helix domain-containing protein n=1 Tax=Cypionkella sinensis TaxID=1756043 RepID=A0ABV7J2Y7_9RHOB
MEKLSQYLSSSGKTQRHFAEEVGVDKSVMSRFLSGKAKPGREVAVRIARLSNDAVPVSSWSSAEPSSPPAEDAA